MQTMIDMKSVIRAHTIVLSQKQMRYLKIKRMLDIFFSVFALIVFSPLMLLVAIGIKIESPREPILFVQLRVGKDYKVFKLFKFRSMRSTAPKNAASRELENPEEYITGFGKLIRTTSIDELPQLFNILRGDMSIIGPRPLVYTEREIRFLRRYYGLYQVRPGLSGMAQINGRDYVSIYVKVAYDRKYMESIGFATDVKLVMKTIAVVLGRVGIAEGKHAKTEDEDKMLDLLLDEEQRRTEAVNI